MSELEVLSSTARLTLRRRLAGWSDAIEVEAVQFVEEYRDLLPKRITQSQLSGLENIAGQAPNYREIRAFLKNRADRADKAGRLEVAAYWTALTKTLEQLKQTSEQLWAELASIDAADHRSKAAVDELHVRLAREYVQHLAAHSLYRGGTV